MRRTQIAGFALVMAGMLGAPAARAVQPTKAQCIASNEDAQDLEHAGKLREARSKLAVCVASTCPGVLREDCEQRRVELEKRIPTVVFAAKDGAGNDLTEVRVTVDGVSLTSRLDGTALALDPGEHHLAFDSDELPTASKTFVLREGEKDRREVIVLRARASHEEATAPVPSRATAHDEDRATRASSHEDATEHASKAPDATASSGGDGQRIVGMVLGGVGLVGLGLGSAFGLISKSTYDHAIQSECSGDPRDCSAQGSHDGATAHSQAILSTAAFVAGSVAFVAGAAVYLTAPKSGVAVGANVAPGVAQLRVVASW